MLKSNSYGKSYVRLTKVSRHGDRHELKELSVDIELQGDFARCYTHGDNSKIIATDSMKNTVYVLAKDHPIESIEDFARHLANHFVDTYPQVACATATIREAPWQRISVNAKPHDHSFVGGSCERRTCSVTSDRKSVEIEGGIDGLLVLKTTKSGFVGYVRDRYTTLKETTDRIFATSVTARWQYSTPELDGNRAFETIRTALLEVFATHDSLAVQQTLLAMGEEALKRCAEISEIELTMPNQHRLLVNLQPFGMNNPNEIFVPTNEPFGLIKGTVSRG
jgi:urate oxidase